MLRKFLVLSGVLLCATAVLAAADIPTRYSGSFPSDGVRMRITGTFTGTALSLSFVVKEKGGRDPTRRGTYACAATSPTQTRCAGKYSSGDGTYTGAHVVTVTWSGGKPVAMGFGH